MATPASFMTSVGTGMGAPDQIAIFSWTKGPRWWSLRPGDGLEQRRLGEADVRMWTRPSDKKQMVISIGLKCPNCLFPFSVRPKNGTDFSIDPESQVLTFRAPVECPAKWPEMRNGFETGGEVACGWKAVIVEGRCHQINGPKVRNKDGQVVPSICPCASPEYEHTPRNCRCGGYPTDDERMALINPGA